MARETPARARDRDRIYDHVQGIVVAQKLTATRESSRVRMTGLRIRPAASFHPLCGDLDQNWAEHDEVGPMLSQVTCLSGPSSAAE